MTPRSLPRISWLIVTGTVSRPPHGCGAGGPPTAKFGDASYHARPDTRCAPIQGLHYIGTLGRAAPASLASTSQTRPLMRLPLGRTNTELVIPRRSK
jgi:hypothetical protein